MNERSENRKALPKFFVTMALSLLGGGVLGFVIGCSRVFGLEAAALAEGLSAALSAATPWGIPATSVLTLGACFLLYRTAAGKYAAWGGGDEDETSASIDVLLSWTLLLSAVQLLFNLFFLAAFCIYHLDGNIDGLTLVGVFLLSCGLVIFAQQKAVDLERKMNPEKRGSVYDTKFQKKWLDSCDESERRQIGEASYQAYTVTNRVCLWLWMVLVILSLVFDIGLLPVLTVMIPWGTLQAAYVAACIRMGRSAKRSFMRKPRD